MSGGGAGASAPLPAPAAQLWANEDCQATLAALVSHTSGVCFLGNDLPAVLPEHIISKDAVYDRAVSLDLVLGHPGFTQWLGSCWTYTGLKAMLVQKGITRMEGPGKVAGSGGVNARWWGVNITDKTPVCQREVFDALWSAEASGADEAKGVGGRGEAAILGSWRKDPVKFLLPEVVAELPQRLAAAKEKEANRRRSTRAAPGRVDEPAAGGSSDHPRCDLVLLRVHRLERENKLLKRDMEHLHVELQKEKSRAQQVTEELEVKADEAGQLAQQVQLLLLDLENAQAGHGHAEEADDGDGSYRPDDAGSGDAARTRFSEVRPEVLGPVTGLGFVSLTPNIRTTKASTALQSEEGVWALGATAHGSRERAVAEVTTVVRKLCDKVVGGREEEARTARVLVAQKLLRRGGGQGGRDEAIALLRRAYRGSTQDKEGLCILTGALELGLPYESEVKSWTDALGRPVSEYKYGKAKKQYITTGKRPFLEPPPPLTDEEELEACLLALREEGDQVAQQELTERDIRVLAQLRRKRIKPDVLQEAIEFICSDVITQVAITRVSSLHKVREGDLMAELQGVDVVPTLYLTADKETCYQTYADSMRERKRPVIGRTAFMSLIAGSQFRQAKAKGACDMTNLEAYSIFEQLRALCIRLLAVDETSSKRLSTQASKDLEALVSKHLDAVRLHVHRELPIILRDVSERGHSRTVTHCARYMMAAQHDVSIMRHHGHGEKDAKRTTLLSGALSLSHCDCREEEHVADCADCNMLFTMFAWIDSAIEQLYEGKMGEQEVKNMLEEVDRSRVHLIYGWFAHTIRGVAEDLNFEKAISELKEGDALVLFDYARKINPEKHREGQAEYFGKKGRAHFSVVLYYRDAHGQIRVAYYDLISGKDQQEDGWMSCAMLDGLGCWLREKFPQIKKLRVASDNGPHFHNTLTLLWFLGTTWAERHEIQLTTYNFLEPGYAHKGADVHIAHVKAKMRLWYGSKRRDLMTVEELCRAVHGLAATTMWEISFSRRNVGVQTLKGINSYSEIRVEYEANNSFKVARLRLCEQSGFPSDVGYIVTKERIDEMFGTFDVDVSHITDDIDTDVQLLDHATSPPTVFEVGFRHEPAGAVVVSQATGDGMLVDSQKTRESKRSSMLAKLEKEGEGVLQKAMAQVEEEEEKEGEDDSFADDTSDSEDEEEDGLLEEEEEEEWEEKEGDQPPFTCGFCNTMYLRREEAYVAHVAKCREQAKKEMAQLFGRRRELCQAIIGRGMGEQVMDLRGMLKLREGLDMLANHELAAAADDASQEPLARPPEGSRLPVARTYGGGYRVMSVMDFLGVARKRSTTVYQAYGEAERDILDEAYRRGIEGPQKAEAADVALLIKEKLNIIRTPQQVTGYWGREARRIDAEYWESKGVTKVVPTKRRKGKRKKPPKPRRGRPKDDGDGEGGKDSSATAGKRRGVPQRGSAKKRRRQTASMESDEDDDKGEDEEEEEGMMDMEGEDDDDDDGGDVKSAAAEVELLDFEELLCYCQQPRDPSGMPMYACTRCDMSYHLNCLKKKLKVRRLRESDLGPDWQCPTCKEAPEGQAL